MPLIEPGSRAPSFTLPDQSGMPHRLSALKGSPVVLFFYPKDGTPGCTAEACAFRDLTDDFYASGAAVLGISPQNTASKETFARKHDLTFPVLADDEAVVCAKYGVWQEKKLYGRSFMGVVRTTYLIRPSGAVHRRWDRVKVPGHAADVLAAVRALSA